jgi:hypothetical protein
MDVSSAQVRETLSASPDRVKQLLLAASSEIEFALPDIPPALLAGLPGLQVVVIGFKGYTAAAVLIVPVAEDTLIRIKLEFEPEPPANYGKAVQAIERFLRPLRLKLRPSKYKPRTLVRRKSPPARINSTQDKLHPYHNLMSKILELIILTPPEDEQPSYLLWRQP